MEDADGAVHALLRRCDDARAEHLRESDRPLHRPEVGGVDLDPACSAESLDERLERVGEQAGRVSDRQVQSELRRVPLGVFDRVRVAHNQVVRSEVLEVAEEPPQPGDLVVELATVLSPIAQERQNDGHRLGAILALAGGDEVPELVLELRGDGAGEDDRVLPGDLSRLCKPEPRLSIGPRVVPRVAELELGTAEQVDEAKHLLVKPVVTGVTIHDKLVLGEHRALRGDEKSAWNVTLPISDSGVRCPAGRYLNGMFMKRDNNTMRKVIALSAYEVAYTFKTSGRARSLRVTIYPDGDVTVVAPVGVGQDVVENFMRQRSSWILKKIEHFRRTPRIVLEAGRNGFSRYQNKALALVSERLAYFTGQYDFHFRKVTIKNQKARWGSCSRKGNLNFNYRIALLPVHLTDYIIVHELCHLAEFNHSAAFWQQVARIIPDWRLRRKELARVVVR